MEPHHPLQGRELSLCHEIQCCFDMSIVNYMYRIQFKLALLMHMAVSYIADQNRPAKWLAEGATRVVKIVNFL